MKGKKESVENKQNSRLYLFRINRSFADVISLSGDTWPEREESAGLQYSPRRELDIEEGADVWKQWY
jgi:hypothetical protein